MYPKNTLTIDIKTEDKRKKLMCDAIAIEVGAENAMSTKEMSIVFFLAKCCLITNSEGKNSYSELLGQE